MIEPQHVRLAAIVEIERVPAAIAGDAGLQRCLGGKLRPPSSDCAMRISVVVVFDPQATTMRGAALFCPASGGASATRGGNSPPRRAVPGALLTRT